jgi:redox-sensitive bicupin YhaK (pirin superfamily)
MILLEGRAHDLGDGFMVRRMLPSLERRSVGPFVFFDYFGPARFAPGKGIDVRPHPHIGLATVAYLFEGSQVHRDNLGSVQTIVPGDVNWMVAGRGIVHSERTGPEVRAAGHTVHGIQTWVGLPKADEETAPGFDHVAAADLPERDEGGVHARVVAGHAFGLRAPVKVFSDTLYADLVFAPGSSVRLTNEHPERGVLVIDGTITAGAAKIAAGKIAVFDPGEDVTLEASGAARAMLFGGAPLDGERHLNWNFVSSSKDRIERAREDWKAQRFGKIPGETEFIPLPEG